MRSYSREEKKLFEKMDICMLSPMMFPEPRWISHMANMVAYSWSQGLKVWQLAYTHKVVVDWARNNLAKAASQNVSDFTGKRYTHLLWLDVDHTFNPDLACELACHFLNKDVDVVGALYYSRTGPTLPVAYINEGNPENKYRHYPLIEVPPCLCEVDAIGFGGTMMKTEVFDIVPEPWFTLDFRAGEDIAFCVKAKEHGLRIFVDGRYKLGHIGEAPVVTEADYRRHMEENAETYKDKIKVPLGGYANGS